MKNVQKQSVGSFEAASMIELKPCPFCGGDADFRIRNWHGTPQMKVVCMKCSIESPHGARSSDRFKDNEEYIKAAEEAAKRWNTRAE